MKNNFEKELEKIYVIQPITAENANKFENAKRMYQSSTIFSSSLIYEGGN
jgi:hypothetical protein